MDLGELPGEGGSARVYSAQEARAMWRIEHPR